MQCWTWEGQSASVTRGGKYLVLGTRGREGGKMSVISLLILSLSLPMGKWPVRTDLHIKALGMGALGSVP